MLIQLCNYFVMAGPRTLLMVGVTYTRPLIDTTSGVIDPHMRFPKTRDPEIVGLLLQGDTQKRTPKLEKQPDMFLVRISSKSALHQPLDPSKRAPNPI